MFSKGNRPQQQAVATTTPAAGGTPPSADRRREAGGRGEAAATPSVIGTDLRIQGNLSTRGEVRVDGRIEGDVEGRAVTVGGSGSISGQVSGDEVSVEGTVEGTIRAKKVHLAGSCTVSADIWHDVLQIDEGASFEGQCKRNERAAPTVGAGARAPDTVLDVVRPAAVPAEREDKDKKKGEAVRAATG